MNNTPKKFFWHMNSSSGGTLSLNLRLEGNFSKNEKEKVLADTLAQCYKMMSEEGSQFLSSRDVAENYGKSRQYWEKLLNEGKILYQETSAGRITTDLWVKGYLGTKEEVDGYVRNVRKILKSIKEAEKKSGKIHCTQCGEEAFNFSTNGGGNINGVCRSCNFYIHTTQK